MKKLISILITAAFLAAMFCFPAAAEIDKRLENLQGSYIELFPEFAKEEFHDYWLECIGKYVEDPEMTEQYYQMLVGSCMGELKGQDAVAAYTADPDSIVFNCFFSDGVIKIVIEGDVISGYDADGKIVFSHTYSYTEDIPMNVGGMTFEGMNFHIIKLMQKEMHLLISHLRMTPPRRPSILNSDMALRWKTSELITRVNMLIGWLRRFLRIMQKAA